MSFYNVSSCV